MNEITTVTETRTLDSREVAQMIDMRHADLMRNIGHYIEVMGKNAKLRSSDFFIERTYKQAGNGKKVKRYDITKQGCEMVANKLTGKKGILFTAEYVKRFNEMEQGITKDSYMIADPIERAKAWIHEREQYETVLAEAERSKQIIGELKPKADYTDRILRNKGLVTITQIARDYGMSGNAMNKKLHELHVIYRCGSGQWLLYSKYQAKGYTQSETVDLTHSDGTKFVQMNTKWTQKGRLFTYELLKKNGTLPMIETDDVEEDVEP